IIPRFWSSISTELGFVSPAVFKGGTTMGSAVLGEAISAIRDWSVKEANESRGPHATETFGSLVFNDEAQQKRLPTPVYHALRLPGTRLHGLASDQPAVAAAPRRRRHARHSDGIRQLDGRNARQEDAAAPFDGSAVQASRPRVEVVWLDGRARRHDLRSGTG